MSPSSHQRSKELTGDQAVAIRQKEHLTVQEFAWLFSVSVRHIEYEAARGRIYFTRNGKLRRINRREIERYDAYLEKSTLSPQS
ncbi:MAG: excisionase family DNA-binding protein [Armatimonadetes bacterium]|nr:excisionase family DNA-binding protein [Armatimonadota bacterium]